MRKLILILSLLWLMGCFSSRHTILQVDSKEVTEKVLPDLGTVRPIAVDTHGVPLDTDGDGIPDYRDKELLTPYKCFPVDSSGVGLCPDPECCIKKEGIIDPIPNCSFESTEILFTAKNYRLDTSAKKLLDEVVKKMINNPTCEIIIGIKSSSKKSEVALSWKRISTVIDYLVARQVGETRILFGYDLGELDIVEIAWPARGPYHAPRPALNRSD